MITHHKILTEFAAVNAITDAAPALAHTSATAHASVRPHTRVITGWTFTGVTLVARVTHALRARVGQGAPEFTGNATEDRWICIKQCTIKTCRQTSAMEIYLETNIYLQLTIPFDHQNQKTEKVKWKIVWCGVV